MLGNISAVKKRKQRKEGKFLAEDAVKRGVKVSDVEPEQKM